MTKTNVYSALDNITDSYCAELSIKYGLNQENLKDILEINLDDLIIKYLMCEGSRDRVNQGKNLDDVPALLNKLTKRLDRVTDEDWEELDFFQHIKGKNPSIPTELGDHIQQNAKLLSEIMDRFVVFFKNKKVGRPSVGATGDKLQLDPLHDFCIMMNNFWISEKGQPFSQLFINEYEREGSDPDAGDLTPSNDSSMFFCAVVDLSKLGYTIANCQNAMKKVIKKAKK